MGWSVDPTLTRTPLSVASILADMKMDAVCIAAAILHDVVEDTFAELSDIRREFGREVEVIIDGLTKISGVFEVQDMDFDLTGNFEDAIFKGFVSGMGADFKANGKKIVE